MKIHQTLDKKGRRIRFVLLVGLFAGLGAYIIATTLASPYNPYNPSSETGTATYYDNTVVGGQGYCAAIHYSRGKTIKVTNNNKGNPKYGASIKCVVSDAGPFGPGRVVDLNTEDFTKLSGDKSVGVLKVRLELIEEKPVEKTKKPAARQAPEPEVLVDKRSNFQKALDGLSEFIVVTIHFIF